MNVEPFAIVINFSITRIWGKIGPFESWKEANTWCELFRQSAKNENADMTALTGEQFNEIVNEICCRDYLPSKDAKEIISNAQVTALFRFP